MAPNIQLYDSKPEFTVTTIAAEGKETATTSEGIGVTGGWNDLFAKHDPLDYAILASEKAVKLLEAKYHSTWREHNYYFGSGNGRLDSP